MQRWILTTTAWAGIIAIILVAFGFGFLRLGATSETAASPAPGTVNQSLEAASPQQKLGQDSPLPEHPLESMGIAKLTERQGFPEDAITEEEVIGRVTKTTWGPQRDSYVDKHPASAIPATYDAEENTMGPAADNLPVWVVVLDGLGDGRLLTAAALLSLREVLKTQGNPPARMAPAVVMTVLSLIPVHILLWMP